MTRDSSLGDGKGPPSRRAESYAVDSGDQVFNGFVGKVRSLYTASVGDLVLVPGSGGQYGDILIGEIVTPFNAENRISVERYSKEAVPFRKVRWLPARALRRNLSVGLSRRLENLSALNVARNASDVERMLQAAREFVVASHEIIRLLSKRPMCKLLFEK